MKTAGIALKTFITCALALCLSAGLLTACSNSSDNAAANSNTTQSASNASSASSNANKNANKATLPANIDLETATAAELLPYVPDGAYRGTGDGYNGPITVRVVVSGNKMTEIEVIEQSETANFYKAATPFLNDMIEANSTDIDVITTATVTCEGFRDAVTDAIRGAFQ